MAKALEFGSSLLGIESHFSQKNFYLSKKCKGLANPGEGNGKPPCEKFSQENYNEESTLHSNCRRSDSSMALEEENSAIQTKA